MSLVQEDELLVPLEADGYLQKLLKQKSLLDHVWSGFKFTCLFLSLFLSVYCIYLTQSVDTRGTRSEIETLKLKVSQDERQESNQYASLQKLNASLFKLALQAKGAWQAPILFDCFKVKKMNRPGIVNYDGCFIDTTKGAMTAGTGIFTVAEAGIYQLTFTAKYVASNRGRFGAWSDMYVNQKVIADSQREYNGPDSGSSSGGRGSSLSESSTHTVLVIYKLQVGDQVKVQFNRDGTSYIHSDNDHDVHFTGRKLAPLPGN